MPDYEWHDFAKLWQTPGEGEAYVAEQLDLPIDQRASIFEAFGVAHDDAVALASAVDETMAACILDLYRSAVPNAYADWSNHLHPTAAPGLVLLAADDPFGDDTSSPQAAETLGAQVRELDGAGHWWALQQPAEAASVLTQFIRSVAV